MSLKTKPGSPLHEAGASRRDQEDCGSNPPSLLAAAGVPVKVSVSPSLADTVRRGRLPCTSRASVKVPCKNPARGRIQRRQRGIGAGHARRSEIADGEFAARDGITSAQPIAGIADGNALRIEIELHGLAGTREQRIDAPAGFVDRVRELPVILREHRSVVGGRCRGGRRGQRSGGTRHGRLRFAGRGPRRARIGGSQAVTTGRCLRAGGQCANRDDGESDFHGVSSNRSARSVPRRR